MSQDPAAGPPPGVPVGEALARLRREAGLTGQQLARRVDMSQAKISRLENGVGFTVPGDVERVARELGAPREVVEHLVEQAERSNDRMTDWRPTRGAVANMQREVERLEAATKVFRVFQPAVVVGLAQTSEYIRAILEPVHDVRSVPEALSVRVRRQEVLSEPARRFHFVMTETVLRNRLSRPEHMPAQIQRLRELSRQDNVSLRIIPSDAELMIPPYHGFELLDDRIVIVDVFNTMVTTRGVSDVALYHWVFDTLDASATSDVDPILDHHLEVYLDLSRRRLNPPPAGRDDG